MKTYPAKLLLFGEYTILAGSHALAVPVHLWSGHWKRGDEPDPRLVGLGNYIAESEVADDFDLDAFSTDVEAGLHFASSIPQGFGLGSSAAITSAVYDNYFSDPDDASLGELVHKLSTIEAFYHGTSSGMDPLVSYLNAPVVLEGDRYRITEVELGPDAPVVFLINSGIGRFTAPLVNLFKSRLKEQWYFDEIVKPMIVHVDHAIETFLTGQWEVFYEHLSLISQVENERFKEMMPEQVEFIWKQAAASPNICMKLCGAGGGGFFMGFAKPGTDVEAELGVAVELVEL